MMVCGYYMNDSGTMQYAHLIPSNNTNLNIYWYTHVYKNCYPHFFLGGGGGGGRNVGAIAIYIHDYLILNELHV